MYPTLSRMARDYLAIQGSSMPSERTFSSSGITDHSQRNRLTPEVFEALQLLKSAYRNEHIKAAAEAAVHVEHHASSTDITDDDLYLTDT